MSPGARWIPALLATALLGALVGCAGPNPRPDFDDQGFAEDRARRLQQSLQLAREAERTDDLAEREALLRRAVGTYDQHSALWTNLGTVLADQGDYAAAAEAYSMASDLDPTDPRPPYNHGALYARLFWPRAALAHFERSLDRDPNYLNAVRGVAHTRILLREFDRDLLELLDRAIVMETDEQWLSYFQRQRILVLDALEADPRLSAR